MKNTKTSAQNALPRLISRAFLLLGGMLAGFSLPSASAISLVSYDITKWAPVTLALTITTQVTNQSVITSDTKAGIPFVSTNSFATTSNRKYGNIEFLRDLVTASVLTGPARNWVIYAKTGTLPDSTGIRYDDIFVFNKVNKTTNSISSSLSFTKAFSKQYYSKDYTTYAPTNATNSGVITFASRTGNNSPEPKYTYGGPVSISYGFPSVGTNDLFGDFKGAAKDTVWYPNPFDQTVFEYITVPGSAAISGITGVGTYNNNRVLISGSISFGACKAGQFFKQ